jgi:polypeptide N-acetylgalactosaminyltransferase
VVDWGLVRYGIAAVLHEIVLCDDMGTAAPHWLADAAWLDYLTHDLRKIRVLHTATDSGERVGMLEARQLAVDTSSADVATILDSYSEVQPGWLEPMLLEIQNDPNAITFPQMDWETPQGKLSKGGIGCTLGFLWSPLSEHEVVEQVKDASARGGSVTAARPSPVFFGAVFSVRRKRLLELGGFDLEYGYGGTDNIELAFRSWLCGGSVKCTPCSRVYIQFYGKPPRGQRRGHPPGRNVVRTADIWMGAYSVIPKAAVGPVAFASAARDQTSVAGPLEKQRALQTRLGCKSFQWFLDTVYPEADITNLTDVVAVGKFRHGGASVGWNTCLDSMQRLDFGKGPGLYGCGPADRVNQAFVLLRSGKIMPLQKMELCLDATGVWKRCGSVAGVKQREDRMSWIWESTTGHLRETDSGACLVPINASGGHVGTSPCDPSDRAQQWQLQHLDEFTAELVSPH